MSKTSVIPKILILLLIFAIPIEGALNWNDYPNIENGRITIYNGPGLVNSQNTVSSFTTAFSMASGTSKGIVTGFTTLEVPATTDFSIVTSRTIAASNFVFNIILNNNTVIYKLKIDYMVMALTTIIFYKFTTGINLSKVEFYPSLRIHTGVGYRSQSRITYKNTTVEPFYAASNLTGIVVLEGFQIVNPTGTYIHLDSHLNIPVAGTFNTTFITSDDCQVSYVKYSIVLFNLNQADIATQLIFKLGSVEFTNDSTVASTFFGSIRNRYQDVNRMFFGVGSFNFTKINSKKFILDTSVVNNLYSTYVFEVFSNVKLAYYFFAVRNCGGGEYFYTNWLDHSLDACGNTCSGYPDRPTTDNTYNKCSACHNTCLTCNGNGVGSCLTCDPTKFRTLNGPPASNCECMSGYVPDPSGSGWCYPCRNYITGCNTCSSTTFCTNCLTGFTGLANNTCSCSTNWIINGYCSTVLGCTMISVINGSQVCTTCNSSLLMELSLTFGCDCIAGTTLSGQRCVSNCGDNYVSDYEGCDDGNTVDGDGCSSTCTVETDWACVGTYAQGSTCKIVNVTQLSYIGSIRDASSNSARIYYKLSPYYVQYSMVDLKTHLTTNIPGSNWAVSFNAETQLMEIQVQYTSHLQNNAYWVQLHLNDSNYFWNASSTHTATLTGINCELTLDQSLWMYNGLKWVVLVLVLAAIIVTIVSVFMEKWIGLQLIQTYQTVYFVWVMADGYAFELDAIIRMLRYSNGYDDVLSSDYQYIHTLPNSLIALGKQKQFLSNFNITIGLILIVIIIMGVLQIIKRRHKHYLEEAISSEVKKKLTKVERVFAIIFSRVFLMLVFFSMFQIIFSFCVQMSASTVSYHRFSDQVDVTAAIICFAMVFSMISFVLYWYLLLPQDYKQDTFFMNLKFQNMTYSYPIIYLAYQSIVILTISLYNQLSFQIYLLLGLQICYLIFIIMFRPYNTIRNFNRFMHNGTIIFNQIVTITTVGVVLRWNVLHGSDAQLDSNSQTSIYCFLLLILLLLALVLAIVRLAIFNKDVNFNCLKKEEVKSQKQSEGLQMDEVTMRKLDKQRYGQLLTTEERPMDTTTLSARPKRQKKQHNDNRQKREKRQSAHENIQNRDRKASMLQNRQIRGTQQELKLKEEYPKMYKKPVAVDQHAQYNDTYLNQFLNDDYIHWNKKKIPPENKPKVTRSNIKKTKKEMKAELMKSHLEEFIEQQNKNKGSLIPKDDFRNQL